MAYSGLVPMSPKTTPSAPTKVHTPTRFERFGSDTGIVPQAGAVTHH